MTANRTSNLSQNTKTVDTLRASMEGFSQIREENLYAHHRLLRTESNLEELRELVDSVSAKKQLFENNFNGYDAYLTSLVTVIEDRLNYFQDMLSRFESERDTTKALVEGSQKKARRKISYLDVGEGFFKWFFEESFINYTLLDSTKTTLNINVDAGEATLPITKQEEVIVQEIVLGRSTQAIIGAPEGGSNRTVNLLNNRESSGFSCYSKNGETCVVELDLEMSREEIVNFLSIRQLDSTKCAVTKIEAIDIYSSDYTKVEVSEICGSNLLFNENGVLEIHFLPVYAKKISILIKQEKEYYSSGEFVKQIDLKDIRVMRLEYSEEGVFETRAQPVSNLLSLNNTVSFFPESIIESSLSLKAKGDRSFIDLAINDSQVLGNYLNLFKLTGRLEKVTSNGIVVIKESNHFNYDTQGAVLFNPNLPTPVSIDTGYDKSKIKVAHALTGTIKNSANSSVALELDWIQCESDVYYRVKNMTTNEYVKNKIRTNYNNMDSNKNAKLISCETSPIVTEKEGWYDLSLGEFFELDSLKVSNSNINIPEYVITKENNLITGVSVSKSYLTLIGVEKKLEDYKSGPNSFNFDEPIVRSSLKFNSGLATGYEPVEYINGSSEFLFLVNQEEYLNSQNVRENAVIAYELEGEPQGNIDLYKNGQYLREVVKETNVNPSEVEENTPKLDTTSNVVYINVGATNFISGMSLKYQEASSSDTEERFFSVNYKDGQIHFSHPVNELLSVTYKSSGDLLCSFTPAKFLNYEEGEEDIVVRGNEPIDMMRVDYLYTYLGLEEKSVDINGLESYYSPILYSIKVIGA
jgi:hypothetical protein